MVEDVARVEGDLGYDGSGPQGDLLQRRLCDALPDLGVHRLRELVGGGPPVFAGRQTLRRCDGYCPAPIDLDHVARALKAGVSSVDHHSKPIIDAIDDSGRSDLIIFALPYSSIVLCSTR